MQPAHRLPKRPRRNRRPPVSAPRISPTLGVSCCRKPEHSVGFWQSAAHPLAVSCRVCRVTGSLSCLWRAHAGMSLGTPVPHAGRSHRQPPASAACAAFVGRDWAAATHDGCLHAAGTAHREFLRLAHRPAEMHAWVQTLRTRGHGPPGAVCLARPTGPLVSARRHDACLGRCPVTPLPGATYRAAFPPRRAQDDPTDAARQGALLRTPRDTLPPSAPTAPRCGPWPHASPPAVAWSAPPSGARIA